MFHIIIAPSKQDVTIATPRANRFLFIAIFFPKYLASKDTVAIPTIIKAEINIAICAYPAPAPNNLEIVFSSKMDKIKPINKRIASTD